MPISCRYFATVLRATDIPFASSMSAIRLSLSGLWLSSARTRARISMRTACPEKPFTSPEKKYRRGNVPCRHWRYLSFTQRPTVDSCTCIRSAAARMVIGVRCAVAP